VRFIKKMCAVAAVACATFFVAGQTAMATVDSVAPAPPVDVPSEVSTIAIAAPIVTLITGTLIPIVTAFLTTARTPSWVKMIVMIVLNGISAFVTSTILPDGSMEFTSVTFWTWILGVIFSAVSYVIGYKPNNLTSNQGGRMALIGIK
jgi:hypothetical protein